MVWFIVKSINCYANICWGNTIPSSVICRYDKALETHSAQHGSVVIEWSLTTQTTIDWNTRFILDACKTSGVLLYRISHYIALTSSSHCNVFRRWMQQRLRDIRTVISTAPEKADRVRAVRKLANDYAITEADTLSHDNLNWAKLGSSNTSWPSSASV